MKKVLNVALAAASLLLLTQAAQAHPGHATTGFTNGILHPLTGIDHIAAMVAVGLWATQLGKRALWQIPTAFVTMMIAGACFAFAGLHIPYVEQGIAASVLVLGLLIVFAFRMPTWAGMLLVGLFATFHGWAHGSEMHPQSSALTFALGFILATLILHAAGLALGLLFKNFKHPLYTRLAGVGLVACAALLFMGIL
jgi:urease accessory protein